MRRLIIAVLLVVGVTFAVRAADPEIVGNWVGAIDTDRGAMDIGLSVSSTDGKFHGVLKTGHGDWEVTSIARKDGQWTVNFKGAAFAPEDRSMVAATLIGELAFGETSPIYKKLVLDEQRVESIGANFGYNRDPGLWTVFARNTLGEISFRQHLTLS